MKHHKKIVEISNLAETLRAQHTELRKKLKNYHSLLSEIGIGISNSESHIGYRHGIYIELGSIHFRIRTSTGSSQLETIDSLSIDHVKTILANLKGFLEDFERSLQNEIEENKNLLDD